MGVNFEQDNVNEIVRRIAELRDACGYTREEFARKLKLTPEEYSNYEENGSTIPISIICNIAGICGVELSEIMTGVSTKLSSLQITRKGEEKSMERYPGYRMKDMAHRFSNKTMQPMLVTLLPEDQHAAMATHGGQEFNYVLEGSVELVWGEKSYILNQGDSVYFNPIKPHGQRCVGDKKAVFITIISEEKENI